MSQSTPEHSERPEGSNRTAQTNANKQARKRAAFETVPPGTRSTQLRRRDPADAHALTAVARELGDGLDALLVEELLDGRAGAAAARPAADGCTIVTHAWM